ncbi:transglycosylase SLT domain-containing protein [Thalassotalea maritima]|uniref:transglycosylase SLT domain-containing protein n=1 Tax=Thalassotalea maritima TaxID=3242416 RepID=UPI0035271E1D
MHFVTLVLSLSLFFAVAAGADEQREALRKLFIEAESQRFDVGSDAYKETLEKLQGYPLIGYFQLAQLKRNIDLSYETEINAVLTAYRGTPIDWSLRRAWLRYLGKQKDKNRFVKYFTGTSDKDLTCQYIDNKLALGGDEKALFSKVNSIWLYGESLPDSCDPVLKKWADAGYRSPELIWQRIMLASKKRSYSLMGYLAKLLPTEEQYIWQIFSDIRRNPARVANLDQFKKLNKQEIMVIVYGIRRLSYKDETLALSTYEQLEQKGQLTPLFKQQVLDSLVSAIARSQDPMAISWFQSLQSQDISDKALQSRLANLVRQGDFKTLNEELKHFNDAEQNDDQWLYWQGRSLALVGDKEKAIPLYTKVSKERSYYGFLASTLLGSKASLNNKPIKLKQHNFDDAERFPAAQRAMELFALKRFSNARSEWNAWLATLDEDTRLQAAKWAYQQGWYDRAIAALSGTEGMDDVDARFPMPLKDVFNEQSKKQQVNVAWAYAIARKESIFMQDATSRVGALGLMQLMPYTAKYVYGSKLSSQQIINAETNVSLGIKYLRYLLDKFDGNIVLATAAYNAGPGKVRSWIKSDSDSNMTLEQWIETIPYYETRNYVKSVMAFTEIYAQKLGLEANVFDFIINNQLHGNQS